MADKRIDQLTAATSLTAVDLMVTEQSGVAKKVTGDILANSAWNMMQKDASPTKDSTAPVTSGAVYDALGGVFSPTKLATPGPLVHIEDGAYNQPIQGMKIAINPVQNLNGYSSPWPAGGGKNKGRFASNITDGSRTQNGCTSSPVVGELSKVHITGTAKGGTYYFTAAQTFEKEKADNKFLPAGTYTVSTNLPRTSGGVNAGMYINGHYTDGTSVSGNIAGYAYDGYPVTFTISQDVYYNVQVSAPSGYSFGDGMDIWVQIESGSSATAWTPYSNICPISGRTSATVTRTGVNVWDEEWKNGYLGNSGVLISDSSSVCSKNYIPIKQSESFYGKCPDGKSLRICAYKENKTFISLQKVANFVFTLPAQTAYIKFSIYGYGTTYNNDISINYPSTDTSYHAYSGSQISVTFPSSAGTVYGGTLTYNVDGTWTLTVDRAKVTINGSVTGWGRGYGNANYTRLANIVGDISVAQAETGVARSASCLTNRFKSISSSWQIAYNQNNEVSFGVSTDDYFIFNTGAVIDDVAVWLNANPIEFVYPLATKQTYTLTGPEVLTLLGENNIWADTGEIEELAYRADIGLYLTEALNPIKEMLAKREDGMKATRAYSAGEYIVVGDAFYKVAVPIANGATLTPNTNVIKTTVGDQLKALS